MHRALVRHFPRSFYDDLPWFSSWASLLPPYNVHPVADVGRLQLCLGLLFAWAVYRGPGH